MSAADIAARADTDEDRERSAAPADGGLTQERHTMSDP